MRTKLLIGLIVVLSIMGSVFGQESLDIGDTIVAELTIGERTEYTFEAREGDLVQIDLESDDFDAYLYLLDSQGNELVYDDDGGDGLNSRISGYTIPNDGTYTIQTASISDGTGGAYTLSLMAIENNIIEYGEVVTGEVGDDISVFTIPMSAGDVVIIDLYDTQSYDTNIEMRPPSNTYSEYGTYINELHSRLGPYTVEETGDYTLNITPSGTYTLAVNLVDAEPLTLGETVTATFEEDVNVLYFAIENDTTSIVDITVDSGGLLDTKMELSSAWGYVEHQIDDTTTSFDPALSQILLDQSETYYLIISPAKPAATLLGDITVSLTESQLPSLNDGPVTASFDSETYDQIFTFEGTAGETVRLTVTLESQEDWSAPAINFSQNNETFATINGWGLKQFTTQIEVPETDTVNVIINAYSTVTMTLELDRVLE